MRSLPAKFFRRPVLTVAPELLGKYLVRRFPDGAIRAYQITEVEAYDGEVDLASHAARGKTKRTAVMYQPGGVWYVYLIYGMYEMLNIVTGVADYPAAILIRSVDGIPGPGRLTKQLLIPRSLTGQTATRATGLWIEDRGERIARSRIQQTPRIGVAYAGEWAKKPYRFVLKP